MRCKLRRLAVGFLATALSAVPALASGFLKFDVDQLAQRSEAIVHARVVDLRSEWNTEQTMIFTHVTLQVIRPLRGSAGDRIVLRVPGGTVEDWIVTMDGSPEFRLGEEVVVFLSRWFDGVPMVEGYFQGLSIVGRYQAGNRLLRGGSADGIYLRDLVRRLAGDRH